MKNLIFFTSMDGEGEPDLDHLDTRLNNGWTVKSVTPQHVSTATGSSYTNKVYGGFIIVIEKDATAV